MKNKFILFLVVFSMPAFAQTKISKTKGVDIAKYQDFVLLKGQVLTSSKDEAINEQEIFETLRKTVDHELTSRGYVAGSSPTAELVVSYVYDESNKLNQQKSGPLGQTPINDPSTIDNSYRDSRSTSQRILIIQIESRSNDPLWTATCTLSSEEKDLNKAISLAIPSAFKKFPVRKKQKG